MRNEKGREIVKEELRELMEILSDAFDNVDDELFWDAYDKLYEKLGLGKTAESEYSNSDAKYFAMTGEAWDA